MNLKPNSDIDFSLKHGGHTFILGAAQRSCPDGYGAAKKSVQQLRHFRLQETIFDFFHVLLSRFLSRLDLQPN